MNADRITLRRRAAMRVALVAGVAALAVAGTASAREIERGDDRGADRPVAAKVVSAKQVASAHHRRHRRGADDRAGHIRRARGADDGPNHVRHSGLDDGPNHT
jgi:hypothetical protein